jgi:hypothetical protein
MLADDNTEESRRLRDAYQDTQGVERKSGVLRVGHVYTRNDLARTFQITDATLKTGIFQPDGTRSIWIFVTEQKTPDRTQYKDYLDGDLLYWQGQGFRITPVARRAVEQHAMQEVEAYYRRQGWDVDASVAATECFDLRCTRGTTELHVEVKGTTSTGEAILLTRNEVAHARQQYPAVSLAIVGNIQIDPGDPPRAHGGELAIIEPWRIDDGTLDSLAFSYEVPLPRIFRPTTQQK